jgi:protein AbiQ
MDDKELLLVRINKNYCNYLRKYDPKVPYNSGNKTLRPFVGILFEIDDKKYFAPLSSPKPKHLKMKNSLDFLRIKNGELGAVNFNNMIPVKNDNIILLDLNIIVKNKQEEKYINLLKEQLFWLNRHRDKLYKNAKKIYAEFIEGTLNKNIYTRCCDFKLLEKICDEYNKQ